MANHVYVMTEMRHLYKFTISRRYVTQGSKFHLSVSPGQVDFPPDNKITKFCCPSDNLDRGSVARQILVSTLILSGIRPTILFMKSTKTTT